MVSNICRTARTFSSPSGSVTRSRSGDTTGPRVVGLAGGRSTNLVDHDEMARHLVVRQTFPAMATQALERRSSVGPRRDDRGDSFTEPFVGHADHDRVAHRRMA